MVIVLQWTSITQAAEGLRVIDLSVPLAPAQPRHHGARFLLDVGLGFGVIDGDRRDFASGWSLMARGGAHIPIERFGVRPLVGLKVVGVSPFDDDLAPNASVVDVSAGAGFSWSVVNLQGRLDLLLVLGGMYSFVGSVDGPRANDIDPTGPILFADVLVTCDNGRAGVCPSAGANFTTSFFGGDESIRIYAFNLVLGLE